MTPHKHLLHLAFAGLLGLAAVSPLHAAATAEQRQAALLASSCANCHGTDGKLAGSIPAIAGRPASVLESQLLSFKRGEMPHATVMDRLARGYTDEELAILARYFANINR
ncbi:c-type cytochrome [Marinospirillum alkaliphilum]|uniref:Cytochrome c553 n=1 Tax=Marinospirillum alkaliphilum DSM 21637 TaxID=1122209 RepID=A0A1K1ZGX9_9GAMM|nr:c-type cytochrome [Marinospirillum alkaliphilum]SFX73409.1 Cytochrome c553 [Marinospirillum alkaliphilum DSM 21637]